MSRRGLSSASNSWAIEIERIAEVGRFDAEHFDPRFDRLIGCLKKSRRWRLLGDLAGSVRRGAQPDYIEDGKVVVLNSKHVGGLLDLEHAERTNQEFWDNHPRARAAKLDVLVNSTGVGTIGRASCVLHDAPTVVDNHVTIIRDLDPECDPVFLAVFLGSRFGMMQTEKWLSGSSGQVEIYPDDLRRFIIALPPDPVQMEIRKGVLRGYQSLAAAVRFSSLSVQRLEGYFET